jgi:DNA-binding NtrC family response regulator
VTTYFPTVDEPVESAPARPQAAPALEGTETILLVEDEAGVRGLMRKVLEAYGYTVLPAQDAAEALAIEERHHGTIHLVVSDVIMPGLSGPALAQRIVQRRPDITVLFVSGHAGRQAIDLGVSSSNVSFLQKPFTPESLVASVRARLDVAARQTGRVSPPR